MSEKTSLQRVLSVPLHWQIAAALALALLVAWPASPQTTLFGASLVGILDFFGGLFLNALKMIVVPLILASIIVGVSNMAGRDAFGRVGGKTLGFYVVTGFLAIFTGLALVNLIGPGTGDAAQAMRNALPDASEAISKVEGRDAADQIGRAHV